MDRTEAPLTEKTNGPLAGRADLPLPLSIDRAAGVPLGAQVAGQLRAAVVSGQLAAGTALPSSRALAATLGVSRGAVVNAYAELHAEGLLITRHGSGTRVAAGAHTPPERPAPHPAGRWLREDPPALPVDGPPLLGGIDFRLGQPSIRELNQREWRAAWRAALRGPTPGDYGDPAGDPHLREALASYLRRSRGLPARPEDLIVTSGAVQGLGLIARAALQPGDLVAVEEPGYRLARQVLTERGARLLPVRVDEDGLRPDTLPEGPDAPLLLYCTPSHQYPLGSRLSYPRRLALLDWARRNDTLIVEDDYDGEFRYDADPLPPLASLDTDGRVVYLGTLSKVLTPAVRVGYVVAPPALTARLAREKALADFGSPWPVQGALAEFTTRGHLEAHVRRARRAYARKRALLTRELAPLAPTFTLGGIQAGLHACLEFTDPTLSEETAEAALARRGVRVTGLRSYYAGTPEQRGLLLGYGGLADDHLRRGAGIIREVLGGLTEA